MIANDYDEPPRQGGRWRPAALAVAGVVFSPGAQRLGAYAPGNWDYGYGADTFLSHFTGPAPKARWNPVIAIGGCDVHLRYGGGALAGLNNGWLTYIPTTGAAYLHTTFARAIAATATEWAAVELMYDAADLIAAQEAADAANSAIANIARDDLLSPVEAPAENVRRNAILRERAGIASAAGALGSVPGAPPEPVSVS